ncbi:MAG: phosphonate metabolism protein PhnI [Ilumatobacter sp.]|nr:MAG: phosphonate metabolism protein PhnI [Ilumatobacter sp.]
MGYAAARGGLDAVVAAEDLVRRGRTVGDSAWLGTDQLVDRLRLAVDRVMGEAGLWCPELAAAALRQAEGDPIEAAHLLRSYRATLPRFAYTEPTDTDRGVVLRRIVPAYRNPPGPQLLGRTTDYTGRLLDLTSEHDARTEAEKLAALAWETAGLDDATGDVMGDETDPEIGHDDGHDDGSVRRPRRLLEVLRDADLVVDRRRTDDPEPVDITRVPARPPAPRSARLAVMARAETGALVNLWYRNILGPDGYLHEITLGDVRHARLPVTIAHPITGGSVTIGHVRVTEVEAIEDLDGIDEDRTKFDVGYGLCLGHNERKAIAMANLDIACHRDAGASQLEQSILLTTDGLDAAGFLEHLKLPHYVTFRSMVERKEAVRAAAATSVRDAAPIDHLVGLVPVDPVEGDCA